MNRKKRSQRSRALGALQGKRRVVRKPARSRGDAATLPALPPADSTVINHRYRLLFEHNLVGVYRTTLSGKILDCNESMAVIMGFKSRKEMLAHRSTELYYARADRAAFIRRLRRQGKLVNFELTLRRRDDTPVHILENVILMPDENGDLKIIQGTMVDITDRKRAEDLLRESEQKHKTLAEDLRKLTQRLQSVREEERSRIARELHDELGQTLTALNLDLHWLKGHLVPARPEAQERLVAMCELMKETMHSVRRICADLRPRVLDDLGLLPAVEWLVRDFRKATGIHCRLLAPGCAVHLPPEQATDVFRILQEGLTNAARHARATRITVTLSLRRGSFTLKVADNGIGITRKRISSPQSFGLAGMRERALRWGGKIEIQGRPDEGTIIVAQVPVGGGSAEAHP